MPGLGNNKIKDDTSKKFPLPRPGGTGGKPNGGLRSPEVKVTGHLPHKLDHCQNPTVSKPYRSKKTCWTSVIKTPALIVAPISADGDPGGSQAVVVDKTMYVSGQLGMDPASGQLVPGGVKNEAKQALVNMGEILKAAGCDYSNVVKTTVLLADINDFNDVNDIYKQFFRSNYPARAAYQVAALPRGGRVEIEAIAVLGPITEVSSSL
ncbi:unnamed protein product [Ranitomeya imitator]|uniref:2-iminobutanoate/2-iminopropanoate deaminase n=1 Tax=Ranitomeya imitator TaxID=111125 RepID=A0ABN9KVU5_9NEOB|nr:unnamed protein product [Ranitomeya imitator]